MSGKAFEEVKKEIDILIPTLLNDINSKQNTFDEEKVLSMIEIKCDPANSSSIADYAENRFKVVFDDNLFSIL